MSEYVARSISESQAQDTKAQEMLTKRQAPTTELKHGAWIEHARAGMKGRRFSTPLLLLVIVFVVLFAGSIFLFENMQAAAGSIYAMKIIVSSLFAVSLGFILSVWWNTTAKFEARIQEAERIDREYRETLMSLSDSLFDVIHALSTLADNPPRSFVIATEFLLGEYVHLLQSQLRRYGDDVAGLGFDATAFLDEKVRIFDGIRERAGLAVRDMPKDLETLFIRGLALRTGAPGNESERRKRLLSQKMQLASVGSEPASTPTGSAAETAKPVLSK
ncbi:MAG: hypothetical protein ACYTGC_00700 [Planctomycetota bacterium]